MGNSLQFSLSPAYCALIAENAALKSALAEVVTQNQQLISENSELIARNQQLISENAALSRENTELKKGLDNELGHHIPGFENYRKCIDAYANVFLEDFRTVRKSGAEPARVCILCAQEGKKTSIHKTFYIDALNRQSPMCSIHHVVTEADC